MKVSDEVWAILEPAAKMGEGFTKQDLENGIYGHKCFYLLEKKCMRLYKN